MSSPQIATPYPIWLFNWMPWAWIILKLYATYAKGKPPNKNNQTCMSRSISGILNSENTHCWRLVLMNSLTWQTNCVLYIWLLKLNLSHPQKFLLVDPFIDTAFSSSIQKQKQWHIVQNTFKVLWHISLVLRGFMLFKYKVSIYIEKSLKCNNVGIWLCW